MRKNVCHTMPYMYQRYAANFLFIYICNWGRHIVPQKSIVINFDRLKISFDQLEIN